jgi:AraC-like DNA-binding protein
MEVTLLVPKMVRCKVFQREDYIGEDDIFALVLSGSFQFDNGSGVQKVEALEGVNFRRGVRYRRHITEDACLYLFRFRCDEDVLGSGKVVFQDKKRIESTLRLLQLADSLVGQDDFSCKQLLFSDIVNQYRLEQAGQYLNSTRRDEVVVSAISYIRANLHLKLNFKKIASDHFLSYIQFSRRFQKATGTTPQEYVTGLRLKKAKQLLTESNLKIQKIADLCGFSNAYYFSNFFHKHSQMSPAQYRAMNRATEEII